MQLIEKYIEWLVAIALSFACCFDVIKQGLQVVDAKGLILYFNIFNFIILVCLVIYQLKHYKIRQYNSLYLLFFIVYYVAVLLYMTVLREFPLNQMLAVPNSVFGFFIQIIRLILYLICAETIVKRFNLNKFMIVGSIFAIIPSLYYIQYYGLESIQMGVYDHGDDEYLSGLTMGFSCAPLIVCSVFFFKKVMSSRLCSVIFCSIIIAVVIYIMISLGKRGPILWTVVNISICYYVLKTIVR